jgi:hypothetical protein
MVRCRTAIVRKTTVKFVRRGSCKTMVFYSSSRVHPQKNPLPYLEEPLLIFFPGGKNI